MRAQYDRIGVGYVRHRRTDPRIARAIHDALGTAETILNVGAGSGSYEPADTVVVAVEPSGAMARSRPPGAAPVVQGQAEALPFRGSEFDAALVALSLHHWADWRSGVAELRRVSRRQVIFAFEAAATNDFWLTREYFPEIARVDEARTPLVADIVSALGGARVEVVPIPWDCVDGFLCANWRRPHAYLRLSVLKCISSLAVLPPERLQEGVAALDHDLRSGVWLRRHGSLLELTELDAGYRLIVS